MTQTSHLAERTAFIGLDPDARDVLRGLAPLLKKELPTALKAFYDRVRQTPEMRKFFRDEGHINHASMRQEIHWGIIAQAEFSDEYFDAVREVGQVHARTGLEPRWYIGGYSVVIEHLIRALLAQMWPKISLGGTTRLNEVSDALSALIKAVMLDMDLAISVYLDTLAEERSRLEAEPPSSRASTTRQTRDLRGAVIAAPQLRPKCKMVAAPRGGDVLDGEFTHRGAA